MLERLEASHWRNRLHSIVLVAGMLLLVCAIGALIAGPGGLVLLGLIGAVTLVFGRRISRRLVLRMYRARPLTSSMAPELVRIVGELSRRAGLSRPPGLYYIPSRIVNAFALGTRENAALGLTDGILRTLDGRELRGVLAHEISHVRSNDIWVMGLADTMTRMTHTLSLLGQFLLLINLPLLLLGRVTVSWVAILLLIFAPTISALLQLALSRTREYDADRGAVELTGDPRGLASALVRLERIQAGAFEQILLPGRRIPHPSILRTHPVTEDRVRRLLELEERPPSEPRVGETSAGIGPGPGRARICGTPPPGPTTQVGESGAPDGMTQVGGSGRARRGPRWHLSGLWY